jgi:hypothetical protein
MYPGFLQHFPRILPSRRTEITRMIICDTHHVITGLYQIVDVPVRHTEKITSAFTIFHLTAFVKKTTFKIPECNIRIHQDIFDFPQQSLPVINGKFCIGRLI